MVIKKKLKSVLKNLIYINNLNIMIDDNLKSFFSKSINDYDKVDYKVVFKNDELIKFIVSSIPLGIKENIKVLELWSWTWHLSKLIAQKYPNSTITIADFSKKMIDKSKLNLFKYLDRIKIIEWDYNEIEDFWWTFDLIVSSISIHNQSHELKEKLFYKIYKSLNKGWYFINWDFYEQETKELEENVVNIYRSFLESNLEWEEFTVWMRHASEVDKPMRLSKQFELLQKAWFNLPKIKRIYNNEAIYICSK